jgi:hypothetical protein
LVLQAWEPISVYFLFSTAVPDGEDPDAERWRNLTLAGWLPVVDPLGQLKVPVLDGLPAITRTLVRGFIRGRVEIPAHEGSGNPPLIFVKSTLAAESGSPGWISGSGLPCQGFVVAAPGEAMYNTPPVPEGEEKAKTLCFDCVGEVGYAGGYSLIRQSALESVCDSSSTQILIDTEDPLRLVVLLFYPQLAVAPAASEGGEEHGEEAAQPKRVSVMIPEPPPPPPWITTDRWKKKEVKAPVTVLNSAGHSVAASHIFTKDLEPGAIAIKGTDNADIAVMCLALKDPKPHPVQRLLLRRPSLLASGDIFAVLFKRLRIELGTARARRVIMEQMDDWSLVCETGAHDEVDAWVAERKMEEFGEDLRGIDRARSLTERCPDLLDVTAPEISERCAVLEDGLGGKKGMLNAFEALPELLASDATALRRSVDALRSIFDHGTVYRIGARLPRLLLVGEKLDALFAQLQQKFPEIARERLRERTSGEWTRWTDMVFQPGDSQATWMGRIGAEERGLASKDQVHLAGMHGKVRKP